MLERYLKTYNEQVDCADMHFNRLYQVCFINLLCKDFSVKSMYYYLEKPVFTK
jgi:hypothetical protein